MAKTRRDHEGKKSAPVHVSVVRIACVERKVEIDEERKCLDRTDTSMNKENRLCTFNDSHHTLLPRLHIARYLTFGTTPTPNYIRDRKYSPRPLLSKVLASQSEECRILRELSGAPFPGSRSGCIA